MTVHSTYQEANQWNGTFVRGYLKDVQGRNGTGTEGFLASQASITYDLRMRWTSVIVRMVSIV